MLGEKYSKAQVIKHKQMERSVHLQQKKNKFSLFTPFLFFLQVHLRGCYLNNFIRYYQKN